MLIEVVNFLPERLVDDLVILSQQPDLPWVQQELQEQLPRRKLSEISTMLDTALETAHNHFAGLKQFDHLEFLGVTLWQDQPTFYMPDHVDNAQVQVAVQIYLDDRASPGTQFADRQIAYGRNRGYILYNEQEVHGVPNVTPHQGRLSIYALYK